MQCHLFHLKLVDLIYVILKLSSHQQVGERVPPPHCGEDRDVPELGEKALSCHTVLSCLNIDF